MLTLPKKGLKKKKKVQADFSHLLRLIFMILKKKNKKSKAKN